MLWACPLCPSRKQGPAKPRLDATVRFCLACSAKSDRLVARVCPVLEQKRAKREASQKAAKDRKKASAQRAKERSAQQKTVKAEQVFRWQGVDLRAFWVQMQALPTAVAELKKPPTMEVRQCSKPPRSRVGVCWYLDHRVQVSVWRDLPLEQLVDTMIHELAHLVSVARYGITDGRGHKHSFKKTYTLLIQEWKHNHPETAVRVDRRWYLEQGASCLT